MYVEMTRMNRVQAYKAWQQDRRRQLGAGSIPTDTNPDSKGKKSTGLPAHATRIVGKVCFSCHSVNERNGKFCSQCGRPLFRPAPS